MRKIVIFKDDSVFPELPAEILIDLIKVGSKIPHPTTPLDYYGAGNLGYFSEILSQCIDRGEGFFEHPSGDWVMKDGLLYDSNNLTNGMRHRSDTDLVKAVEKYNGSDEGHLPIKIVEVPEDVDVVIYKTDMDGEIVVLSNNNNNIDMKAKLKSFFSPIETKEGGRYTFGKFMSAPQRWVTLQVLLSAITYTIVVGNIEEDPLMILAPLMFLIGVLTVFSVKTLNNWQKLKNGENI